MLILNQGNDVIINLGVFNLIVEKEKDDDCVKIWEFICELSRSLGDSSGNLPQGERT